jgi:hypothetical protein
MLTVVSVLVTASLGCSGDEAGGETPGPADTAEGEPETGGEDPVADTPGEPDGDVDEDSPSDPLDEPDEEVAEEPSLDPVVESDRLEEPPADALTEPDGQPDSPVDAAREPEADATADPALDTTADLPIDAPADSVADTPADSVADRPADRPAELAGDVAVDIPGDADGDGFEDSSSDLTSEPDMISECSETPIELSGELPISHSQSNDGAGDEFDGCCPESSGGLDVAFRWTPTTAGEYVIDTIGSEIEVVIYVLRDNCGTRLACNDEREFAFMAVVELEAEETIIIVIDGRNETQVGNFSVNIKAQVFTEEVCDDRIDDDSDGRIDCAEPSCQGTDACIPGAGEVGQSCSDHIDCSAIDGDPFCLDSFPGGYCSEFCTLCPDNCPDGSACVHLVISPPESTALCLESCDGELDPCSRADYSCQDFYGDDSVFVCMPEL